MFAQSTERHFRMGLHVGATCLNILTFLGICESKPPPRETMRGSLLAERSVQTSVPTVGVYHLDVSHVLIQAPACQDISHFVG